MSGELKLVGDMSFELTGAGAPDDLPCRYGASKLMCRGPRRALDKPYVAFLGGSETYGKFVNQPFVALTESNLGMNCVNLGAVNAGLDAFARDPEIVAIAQGAQMTVIQVFGAQNLSNRYYRVHPRRNDRFLTASPLLSTIYRDVDFTEFHFNKHLLGRLHALSPERFAIVHEELQQAWLSRMRLLVRELSGQVQLLWLRYSVEDGCASCAKLGPEPLLVKREMLEDLRDDVLGIIEIPVRPAGKTGELAQMHFGPMQTPSAEYLIGPDTHREIARQMHRAIRSAL